MSAGTFDFEKQRYAAALMASVLVHALVLAVVARTSLTFGPSSPVIAVTLRDDGGDADEAGAAGGGSHGDLAVSSPRDVVAAASAPSNRDGAARSEQNQRIADALPSHFAVTERVTEPRPSHDDAPARIATTRDDRRPSRSMQRRHDAHATTRPVANDAATRPPNAPAADADVNASSPRGNDVAARGVADGNGVGFDSGSSTGARSGSATAGDGAAAGGNGGDLRARCTACPEPEYPPRARREGWEGTVDVRLQVRGDGAVEEASVGKSSGFAVLDAAAIAVARRSRFHVASATDGITGVLRYRFVLKDASGRAAF